MYGQGWLALRQKDLARARSRFEESVRILLSGTWTNKRVGWVLTSAVEGLGIIAFLQGQAKHAVTLLGTAEAMRVPPGFATSLRLQQTLSEQTLKEARRTLGENSFALAWARGQAMLPQQVLAVAAQLQPLEELPPVAQAKLPLGRSLPEGLTAREIDVLRLLARGLSNQQIAEQLILSVYTVNRHTQSIYTRLGVSSRSAATRYALEHRIL